MANIRYRRGRSYASDMATYTQGMDEASGDYRTQLRRDLTHALSQDITPRQRQCLLLYYGKGLNMYEIAHMLGIDRSTVSRTIKRGEERLSRCLRYGAGPLLRPPPLDSSEREL